MSREATIVLSSDSVERTRAFGAALAEGILSSSGAHAIVIALNGEMGVGKTTLVGGLLRALGIAEYARSPTYTLIEPYEFGNRTLYHLDLYRLNDARDLEMLAVRDLLGAGSVLLVEWAEKAGSVLPTSDLTLTLSYVSGQTDDSKRQLLLSAATTTGKQLGASLQSSSDKAIVSP